MITLISDPSYIDPSHPTNICRWLATESPNNFRLLRRDWIVTGANAGGFLQCTTTVNYTGTVPDDISVYCAATNQMYVGKVTLVDGTLKIITTDIPWVPGMNITYLNDNTLHGGYYFEGRLTINGVLYPLTIIASPDSFGYADLDVSGILRIVTSLGKVGDYTARIMKETTKSGKFNFEYRECWYGSSNTWYGSIITSPLTSPPMLRDWYYGECVRSEEQGSNLHDYVATVYDDAPFLNQFTEPVYFLGLPFDLSFILPEQALVSPLSDIMVVIKIYDSNNLLLSTVTEYVDADALEGYINSLNIDQASIPTNADHITAEISV
jgi:hypothetical protein